MGSRIRSLSAGSRGKAIVTSVALSAGANLLISQGETGLCVCGRSIGTEFPEPAFWDERARPVLDTFLATHAILHPGASLTRADHDRLMVMLERVSSGWLRRDTVVAEPELMWRDQPGVRRVLEQASDLERMSSRRESPAWRGRGG